MPQGIEESKHEAEETAAEEGSASENNHEESESEEDASDESQAQTKEKSKDDSEEDYASELARVKSSLTKAEEKIVKLKKGQEKEIDPEDIVEKVWSKIDDRLSSREREAKQDSYEKAVKAVSSSDKEAELIKFHLENTIKPTGDIEADVETAKLLANKRKILKTNEELARSLRVKQTIGTTPSFSGSKISEDETAELTASEKKLIDWANRASGKK